ncbi:MAG TPA: serine hydroxymethyltransferase, partial [Nitrososphaeria archaeon]|nr:serine hydroxymethyltransferase [Nitrososphaeria archaeon]
MRGEDELRDLLNLIKLHNTWRREECINLIASENVTSPLVDAVYLSDAMHRYAEGLPFKRYYQGTRYVDEIEEKVSRIFARLFDASYADVRAISGTIANATVFTALAKSGEKAAVIPLPGGAHVSHSKYGILGRLGIKPVELPIIPEELSVDAEGAAKLIREKSPKMIILGASVIIF